MGHGKFPQDYLAPSLPNLSLVMHWYTVREHRAPNQCFFAPRWQPKTAIVCHLLHWGEELHLSQCILHCLSVIYFRRDHDRVQLLAMFLVKKNDHIWPPQICECACYFSALYDVRALFNAVFFHIYITHTSIIYKDMIQKCFSSNLHFSIIVHFPTFLSIFGLSWKKVQQCNNAATN